MKISVIIPAYNEEQYLGKTLEAVLAQDYPDFEVIVVDNASTDGTAKIARSFQKAKLGSERGRKRCQLVREEERNQKGIHSFVWMPTACRTKTGCRKGPPFLTIQKCPVPAVYTIIMITGRCSGIFLCKSRNGYIRPSARWRNFSVQGRS